MDKKAWLGVTAAALVVGVCVVQIFAQSDTKFSFSVRKVEEQVVLYTLRRGSYETVGPAIGKLFALAGQKGIAPQGNMSISYLNNPMRVSSEHWLSEIRIPVGKEALKLAGTLGEFTDVKVMAATEAVVGVKPEGMADPGPIYAGMARWVFEHGYVGAEGPSETYLTNAMTGDYSKMKVEIVMPVTKVGKKAEKAAAEGSATKR